MPAKLNEAELTRLGFSKQSIAAFREIERVTGAGISDTTVQEVLFEILTIRQPTENSKDKKKTPPVRDLSPSVDKVRRDVKSVETMSNVILTLASMRNDIDQLRREVKRLKAEASRRENNSKMQREINQLQAQAGLWRRT